MTATRDVLGPSQPFGSAGGSAERGVRELFYPYRTRCIYDFSAGLKATAGKGSILLESNS